MAGTKSGHDKNPAMTNIDVVAFPIPRCSRA
jgi:hypothetical protein